MPSCTNWRSDHRGHDSESDAVAHTLDSCPRVSVRVAFQDPVSLDGDPERAEDDDYVEAKYDEVRDSIQHGMDVLARLRGMDEALRRIFDAYRGHVAEARALVE